MSVLPNDPWRWTPAGIATMLCIAGRVTEHNMLTHTNDSWDSTISHIREWSPQASTGTTIDGAEHSGGVHGGRPSLFVRSARYRGQPVMILAFAGIPRYDTHRAARLRVHGVTDPAWKSLIAYAPAVTQYAHLARAVETAVLHGPQHLIIVGASAGAMLAAMCVAHFTGMTSKYPTLLSRRVAVILSCAPRALGKGIAGRIDNDARITTFRFQRGNDMITTVPAAAVGTQRFAHIGSAVTLGTFDHRLRVCSKTIPDGISYVSNGTVAYMIVVTVVLAIACGAASLLREGWGAPTTAAIWLCLVLVVGTLQQFHAHAGTVGALREVLRGMYVRGEMWELPSECHTDTLSTSICVLTMGTIILCARGTYLWQKCLFTGSVAIFICAYADMNHFSPTLASKSRERGGV